MVSYLEGLLQKKHPTQKNTSEDLGGPQRQFWKEDLLVQYDNNKNVILLSDTIPIKSLSEGGKLLRSLIDPIIKEG